MYIHVHTQTEVYMYIHVHTQTELHKMDPEITNKKIVEFPFLQLFETSELRKSRTRQNVNTCALAETKIHSQEKVEHGQERRTENISQELLYPMLLFNELVEASVQSWTEFSPS